MSQDAARVAEEFCASIGATNEVCHDAVGRAIMRRAQWQCDGRTHPHAPRSLVDHSTLGDVDYTPVKRFADIQRGIQHLHDHGYAVFKGAARPPRRETSEQDSGTSSRKDFIHSTAQNQRPGTCCRSTSTALCYCTVLGRARPCGACASCEEYVRCLRRPGG